MDNLERFVKDNRSTLDRYKPAMRNWKKIKTVLHKTNSWSSIPLFKAAIVIVALGASFAIYKFTTDRKSSAENIFAGNDVYFMQPQLRETELYYNSIINDLYSEAKPLLTVNPGIEEELKTDFTVLDSLCTDIKNDLKDNIANKDVVEALIQNYRAKIRILEEMLIILEQNNEVTEIKESHEL